MNQKKEWAGIKKLRQIGGDKTWKKHEYYVGIGS
jgi:hypothetical protein